MKILIKSQPLAIALICRCFCIPLLSREALLKRKGSVRLTSLYQLVAFDFANIIYRFTKQATLMRRSTGLSLPLQSVFPVLFCVIKINLKQRH